MAQRQPMTKALEAVADELLSWMFNNSFPMWSTRGINASNRFYESLNFEGNSTVGPRSRVRTQARQVYSFALAYELGWNREVAADIVKRTVPPLLQSALREDGIAGRCINIDSGELLDATADLYDTAFCLLALAQSRDIVGHGYAEKYIDRLLAGVDAFLMLEGGEGYRESLPPNQKGRLQNPHMHFFESLLLLYDKTGSDDIWRRAEELYSYIGRVFFDTQAHLVREVVQTGNGEFSPGYDPGHSMEWVWLLGYRSRLSGGGLPQFAYQLYEHALEAQHLHGNTRMWLSDTHQIRDGTARLWSQTEALKGHLCIAELGCGEPALHAAKDAADCAKQIAGTWLTAPVAGGWLDRFDQHGELIATGIPASTGYHLYLAIAESARVAAELRSQGVAESNL